MFWRQIDSFNFKVLNLLIVEIKNLQIKMIMDSLEYGSSRLFGITLYNSFRPGDTYMSVDWSSLVQVMVCCLFGNKPLPEPILT